MCNQEQQSRVSHCEMYSEQGGEGFELAVLKVRVSGSRLGTLPAAGCPEQACAVLHCHLELPCASVA